MTVLSPGNVEARAEWFRTGANWLAIEVTNLAANRIRHMHREKIPWRIFEDINFVNLDYRAFDASDWEARPLGLFGPVTIQWRRFQANGDGGPREVSSSDSTG